MSATLCSMANIGIFLVKNTLCEPLFSQRYGFSLDLKPRISTNSLFSYKCLFKFSKNDAAKTCLEARKNRQN